MVDYRSAGTVEYLYDTDSGKWYFLGEYTDSIGKFVTKIRQFVSKIRHKSNESQKYFVTYNLFVTSKNETTNSRI